MFLCAGERARAKWAGVSDARQLPVSHSDSKSNIPCVAAVSGLKYIVGKDPAVVMIRQSSSKIMKYATAWLAR